MRKGILIDIDTLFDTRAGLACLLDSKNTEVIKSGEYRRRLRDNIGNISSQIFHTFYRDRNKHLLELAIPTPILKDLVYEDYKELMGLPYEMNTGRIPIYINIYPYDLNKNEMKRILYIVSSVCNGADIKFINLNYEELSPQWVSENLKRMYMYSGLYWFDYQCTTRRILEYPLIDVMLVVPTIIDANVSVHSLNKNTFIAIKKDLEKLIDLYFIDTIYFCGVELKPKEKENEEN